MSRPSSLTISRSPRCFKTREKRCSWYDPQLDLAMCVCVCGADEVSSRWRTVTRTRSPRLVAFFIRLTANLTLRPRTSSSVSPPSGERGECERDKKKGGRMGAKIVAKVANFEIACGYGPRYALFS
jgi:hypothetical protein